MIYVMSDIHGEYKKYTEMLEKINFSDEDTLYILGDVIDRGPEPVRVILDMYSRKNVRPIMGNHEIMALKAMAPLMKEDNEEGFDRQLFGSEREYLHFWMRNGGETTFRKFEDLSPERRRVLWSYIEGFRPFEMISCADGRTFILSHAGLGNYYDGKSISEYTLRELACERPKLGRKYYNDAVTVVVGHTPTLSINGQSRIFESGNMKFIDCGAAFGGNLACICLDTMEEFYV